MTQSATMTTVRRQIQVNAPITEAFKAFTERFGDFKPREHNLLRSPIAETVFEPRVGCNIYDRAVDGTECRWARILAFEPPDRVVFSWDISPRWQVETNPDLTSEVEVRFFAETPERTRVELEHRNIDRHGPGWESVRDAVGNEAGWPVSAVRGAVRRKRLTVIPSSVNAFRAEHRQLPGVRSLIVADEVRVAVRASQFEVPVVGRQPRVEHFRDGDATISKNQRAWHLLAAVACITLDTDDERLLMHPLTITRDWLRHRDKADPMFDLGSPCRIS